ncbi:hypothetical protein E4U54_008240 [Claviceps lovelessii]|nr:hypothetical protein E4U54_008240 [Claviceps lovelessii]
MELWVFDRSGAYSSGTFDIHDEPDKFARALVGYTTMGGDLMGLDVFVERQDGHRYVTLDDATGKEVRLRLNKAMVRQKAIRKLEVEHLRLAEAMGVEGVARVVAHRRITTIAEMQEGLQFSAAHRFRGEDVQFDDPPTTTSTSSKRKSSSDHTSDDASASKRRRSTAGRVISDFRTIKELLESERDAIKAHRSLYVKGKILHRDISSNNIIITDPETANGFKGMLIDLDLAKMALTVSWASPPKALNAMKPLCLRIRKILFPLDKDERMSFGTPAGDPDQLYKPIIAAYDEVISKV